MKSVSALRRGFTIVELLVVIAVIAILATISIVTYNGIQDRARASAANSELKLLEEAAVLARERAGTTLIGVTGHGCTGCVGTQVRYEQTLANIAAASGADLTDLKDGDPWGNMYYIDENEGEGGSCANKDWISVNPAQSGVTGIRLPFYECS